MRSEIGSPPPRNLELTISALGILTCENVRLQARVLGPAFAFNCLLHLNGRSGRGQGVFGELERTSGPDDIVRRC